MHRPLIELRALAASDLIDAAGLLAVAMADNPTHAAVFGLHPARRTRRLRHFFRVVLPYILAQGRLTGAFDARGALVGVVGALPPGRCQPAGPGRLALVQCFALSGTYGESPRGQLRGAWPQAWWAMSRPRNKADGPLAARPAGSQKKACSGVAPLAKAASIGCEPRLAASLFLASISA